LLFDPSLPFLWLFYLLVLFLYSASALGYKLNGDKSPIFSARNLKPRRMIFLIHAVFLGVVFDLLLLATHLYLVAEQNGYAWLTMNLGSGTVGRRGWVTPLDLISLGVGSLLVWFEQRFIYVDAKTGNSDLPDKLDYY